MPVNSFSRQGSDFSLPNLRDPDPSKLNVADIQALAAFLTTTDISVRQRQSEPTPYVEDETTRCLRLTVEDCLNVRIEYKNIDPLAGIMIAWKGIRHMTLDAENSSVENVHLALHLLGHIALGHIDEGHPVIKIEPKASVVLLRDTFEREADDWAIATLRGRRYWRNTAESESFRSLRTTLLILGIRRNRTKMVIHRVACWAARHVPPYRILRDSERGDQLLDRVRELVHY